MLFALATLSGGMLVLPHTGGALRGLRLAVGHVARVGLEEMLTPYLQAFDCEWGLYPIAMCHAVAEGWIHVKGT